jgi:hypothetical protein
MTGTTKCPQVRSAISVANIYCHELAMRVFNSQLKVTETELGSYLKLAASRSNTLVQQCEIVALVPSHRPQRCDFRYVCAKADRAQMSWVATCGPV